MEWNGCSLMSLVMRSVTVSSGDTAAGGGGGGGGGKKMGGGSLSFLAGVMSEVAPTAGKATCSVGRRRRPI
ncbi:unnamed protein product [Spirodela intermedia]|uniref:Uncharacterized protein n=1 Tax=Spirodela intermedia TaxID=51605 RepID=A0A7I8LJ46_SPIIN|nr:unnamed protein product [Spirodela intermedia]